MRKRWPDAVFYTALLETCVAASWWIGGLSVAPTLGAAAGAVLGALALTVLVT